MGRTHYGEPHPVRLEILNGRERILESVAGLSALGQLTQEPGPWRGLEDVECATLEWVHWYNTQRLLEPIGNVPPVEYEMNYYRSQEGSLEMARLN